MATLGGVGQTPLDVLARADRADRIPRLGGMARADGVVIVSERRWAFAGRDGSIREGMMPQPPAALEKLPMARGLLRLGASLSPLFKRRGIAGRKERWLLLLALIAPFFLFFLPHGLHLTFAIVSTIALGAWLLRGRTLRLHGAEHRAIAAAEFRQLVATWNGAAKPSRFSPRCGTNFAALALPVTWIADRLWPLAPELWTPLAVTALSLAVTMELWRAVQAKRALRALLLPGLALQRLTTREPALDDTHVALRAVAAVLAHEL